jgi:hypothetical protein
MRKGSFGERVGSGGLILARFWPPGARSCRCQRLSGIVAQFPGAGENRRDGV